MPNIRPIGPGSTERELVSRMSEARVVETSEAAATETPTAAPEGAQPADRSRDERGKFVKAEEDRPAATEPTETDHPEPDAPITEAELSEDAEVTPAEAEPEVPAIDPPQSWSDAHGEVFAKLPPEVQQIVAERESEREANLTKRSQEDVERTRLHKAAMQDIEAERQHFQQNVQPMVQRLGEQLQSDEVRLAAMLDPESDSYSPEGYMQERHRIEQQQKALQEASGEAERIEQRRQEQAHQIYVDDVKANERLLAEAIPAWKTDPKKGRDELQEIREYSISKGVPREMAENTYLAPLLLIARTAMQADRMKAALVSAKGKKVTPAPKLAKPGPAKAPDQSNREKHVVARQQLRRNAGTRGEGSAFGQALRTGGHMRR